MLSILSIGSEIKTMIDITPQFIRDFLVSQPRNADLNTDDPYT